ncbi:uncharacterized protein LOC142169864 [Nicotiana tabacum]|uniref:Uncharacterized protein LOC142169864 n=1 Tax=Nicotiana tabacum TaxID=4097 RepID=A0AC58SSF1_TOBAC
MDSSDPGSEDTDDEEDVFRIALQDYVVQRRVKIKLRPNEQRRVMAICVNLTKCRWHILGSLEGQIGNFIVRSYYPVAKYFKDKIINQLDIKLKKLRDFIRIKYGVYVGKSICVRAKHQVMGKYLGDYKLEFARIYDYADMLRSTNPDSTIVLKTSKETIPGKELFVGIYICLHACKLTEFQGEGLTIISDMQKKGEERRKKFWACARAPFEAYLKAKIDELSELSNSKIIEDLLRYPKQSWCRAFFKDWSKCDYVENNMCETFNNWIMSARHKSIITMLEEIRVKVIERITTMREFSTRKETYLKSFSCYIQPVTNTAIWTATQNPTVEPHVITKMLGRPKKNRRKAQDEPKKKFGKRSRKGTPMTYSHYKTVGHNKKGCPILDKDLELLVPEMLMLLKEQLNHQLLQVVMELLAASGSGTAATRNTQPSTVASQSTECLFL